jgi:hypothetical protein
MERMERMERRISHSHMGRYLTAVVKKASVDAGRG